MSSQQQQQQQMYTIHESQQNNNNNNNGPNGQRNSNTDILIDTSSIPMTQQPMPPMQHHHLQPQPASQFDTITSQPMTGAGAGGSAGSARVAPEDQNVVYSVHPVFNMLDSHDTLLIRQKADCTSTCCGFESANTYTVRAKDGSPLLKAIENSNCCERCCCEGNREYNLSLVQANANGPNANQLGDESAPGDAEVVAKIKKPYRVSRFCCYTNAVRIESPEDNPIGHIKQLFTFFGHTRYAIYDCQQPPKKPSFILESTSCRFCCTPLLCTCICGNKEFRIISTEAKEEVGSISRHWSSDGDTPFGGNQMFGVQFAPNLEARHKVLLLSACFMMDFFYFENDRRRRKLASC